MRHVADTEAITCQKWDTHKHRDNIGMKRTAAALHSHNVTSVKQRLETCPNLSSAPCIFHICVELWIITVVFASFFVINLISSVKIVSPSENFEI